MSQPDLDREFKAFVRSFRLREHRDELQRFGELGLVTVAPGPETFSPQAVDNQQSPSDETLLPAPRHLIGRRDELDWLLDRLRLGSAAGVTALSGIGGIGKTALAAVAIRELKAEGRFRDGIVVFRCQDKTDPVDILRQVLARFDPLRRKPDTTDIAGLTEVALRLLAGDDALVVLDNIEPPLAERLNDVIGPLRAAGTTLLLTARQQLPRDIVTPSTSRELKLLSEQEAIELFVQSYGARDIAQLSQSDRAAVRRIVRALERHTLAVKLAGAYAADLRRPLDALAQELETDPLRVPDDAGERAVSLAFKESTDQLTDSGQRLFAALSAFATPQFGRGAALALAGALGLADPEPTLALLVRRALLDPFSDDRMPVGSDRERLELHPLLRAYAASQLTAWPVEEQDEAHYAVADFYATYIRTIGEAQLGDSALAADAANIGGALEWAIRKKQLPLMVALCYGMRNYWLNRWHTDDVRRYAAWSVKAADDAAKANADAEYVQRVADIALMYGRVRRRFGDMEAADLIFRSNLAVRRRISDRRGEAAALHQLGQLEHIRGRLDAAVEYFNQSIAICREVGDRLAEGTNIGHLGRIAQARGLLKDAEDLFKDSLEIAHAERDVRGEAVLLSLLGQLELARGTYYEAEDYLTRSLNLRRKISDRQGESVDLSQLGRLALDRGQFDVAERYFRRSLEIKDKLLDRPNRGVDLSQLALVFLERGELDEAEQYLQRSLPIRREVHDRRGEGVDLALQGRIALQRGQLTEAERLYRESLKIAREVQNRRGEGVNLRQLASIYEQRQEFDIAEEYYRQALKIGDEVDNGLDVADALLALGRFLIVQRSDRDRGCPMLQDAIKQYNKMGVPGEQIARDTARRHGCPA